MKLKMHIVILILLYLMVHVDSHTISKSIANDERVDGILDSITDLESTSSPKQRRDRIQHTYRSDNKDAFVRPEYVFKDTKLYSNTDRTTQTASPQPSSEHSKHHKSPKRRVGSFWRKLRGKDKKIRHENISRSRRLPKNRENVPKYTVAAVSSSSKLKNKRKNKNTFTPRPPDGKYVKRDLDTAITDTVPSIVLSSTGEPMSTSAPISTNDPYSLRPNCNLRIGKTHQFDNMLKNKFRIKTVEPYKITERVMDPLEESEATQSIDNASLETLSTQLAHLKEKYGLAKVSSTYTLSESNYRTETSTPKHTTATEANFPGTAQIEALLNDIKMKAMARMTQESPMLSDIITNTVTEATFEADHIVAHATQRYNRDAIVSSNDISNKNGKRTVSSENENKIYLKDPTLIPSTESHYVAARSIKEDTITMAHNVEDMLQRELKLIYNKVKHKVSSDLRKEINKAKCTIKESLHKISSCAKCNNVTTTKTTVRMTTPTKKVHTTSQIHKTTVTHKEKATSRHPRNTPTQKTTPKSDLDFTKTTYDDYVMLTLYEEMLAKTHEENVRKMLATANVTPLKKRRHHIKLSKRNPETLTNVKLREVVEKLYDDGVNMPEYDYIEPSANMNISVPSSDMPDLDNGSLEPMTVPEGIMAEPDQHIHNSMNSPTVSGTEENLSDTSLEGLSNKISYNDFVNGYKHYLKFQKEQSNQNFSNLVKYQAHRHHSVDDIGKFILNKIPPLPSLRGRRFLDENDMDYQEITTKSDDSWFKKHFYLFIDNGPPKKFHTAQTVELKSAVTEASKTFVTNPMMPRPKPKDQVYIRIGADERQGMEVGPRTNMDTSLMNLEDLSRILDSIKSKQTMSPFYKVTGLKSHSKSYVVPKANVTEDTILQIRMIPQNFIGRLFGGKRRQAHLQNHWTYSGDWSPIDIYTENPLNRWKRTVKGSVSVMDDFINKDLEEKPTTGSKEVFAEPVIKTRETNKYGYVDIDLVPRQTAVVKLRENTKKSRFKNFFKRFSFRKSKSKSKHDKRSVNAYYGEDAYSYTHRRSRFNPIKKLKDMFRVKPEAGKEEGGVYNMANMQDYDMMTSHIDSFKPVRYDKPMSIDEMQRLVPNISDIDPTATKPVTGGNAYRLDESDDSALLSNDPVSQASMPTLPEHKEFTPQVPQPSPQVLDLPNDWHQAAVAISAQTLKTAQKDPTPLTPYKTTTTAITKSTIPIQATTAISPTDNNAKKTDAPFTKITKTQKTTVQQKQPPNNVMTVNLKTLKPTKTKTTRVSKVTKRSTTTITSTTTTTTTTTPPPPTTPSTEACREEPAGQLFTITPSELFDTDSIDLFNTEATQMMTLDDINLILRNIQHKLQKIRSTEFPKISTAFFKRGTISAKKHYKIPVSIPKPPREIEELTIRTKLTRIAKFPIIKRHYKVKNVEEIPVHDESDYPGINEEQLKEYPHDLTKKYSDTYMKVAGKPTPFYSSTPQHRTGYKKFTDFFNDLVMWHNDILNLDKVPRPMWKDILHKVNANAVESYTTPNMSDIMKELKEMNEYLAAADLASIETTNHSQKMDPYLQMAFTDRRKRPSSNKQAMIQSVAMDDNAIVTSKDFLIRGEAKYYQYNRPGLVAKRMKSSDFIRKLNKLNAYDEETMSKVLDGPRRLDPSSPFYETKEPAILVDTSLMAYDDDADTITRGLEVKKLSRDSQKSNKSPKKHGHAFTPFLKTNKPPMQYFTTPLPMKSNEFNKFLKEHMMDVESLTSPILELPTFNDNWITKAKAHKRPTSPHSTVTKTLAAVTKASVPKLAKIDSLKKMNSELLKSINYTSQLMVKAKPSPRLQANSKKNSFVDDFDRYKRFSDVSKVPRLVSIKTDKVNQEENYYNLIKKKMKERLFEKKGTHAEHASHETVTLDPLNKEVEITIINFDDIEKLTSPPTYETFTLPVLKTEDTTSITIPPFTTDLTDKTMTTAPSTTTTEFAGKFDFAVKDDMHNGLLYKDIFKDEDKTTTTSTELSTQESKSTTEYVDPSINETPSTTKIKYPFEKIPHLYPNILGKMPRVRNFNAAPKRVQISSHHYKYDIFYDDNKKIVKSGFNFHTKEPTEALALGNKLRDNIIVLRHPVYPYAPVRGKQGTSLRFGKRSQLKDNYPRAPDIFRKGETEFEVIRKPDRSAKRNRQLRRVSDTEVTNKHRLFTWRGCKPKPDGRLSEPGENPEDQIPQKEARSSLDLSTAVVTLETNNVGVTVDPNNAAIDVDPGNAAISADPDITFLRDIPTQRDVAVMAAVTGCPITSPTLSPSPAITTPVSLKTSMATATEGTPQRGSLVYDLKNLRRASPSPADKDKMKEKDRHRRLFKISALLQDKFKSLMRNLTTTKRAQTTISTTKHATKAATKCNSTHTTQRRGTKKEKEVEREDLKTEGISFTCRPKENTKKEDTKCTKKHAVSNTVHSKTTTPMTVQHKTDETETGKPTHNKCINHTGHLSNDPISIEPDTYNEQEYIELAPQHHPLTPPPQPCPSEATFFGNHIEMKRDVQTQQNIFTAKDVAALEVIVDLMKNTLSYEEKDIAGGFQSNNYVSLPHPTKSIHSSNGSTNAIQVHIAIPFDFQSGKKRSPFDPVRVRKVFSAKMSTPVDLEYQVHSFEGTLDPTTEHIVTTTSKPNTTTTTTTVGPRVSVEGALSPGVYLLVDKPKSGLALKPIKGRINLSDLKTRQVPTSTASMSESKPTEAREETKSIARVTLSKDFIAAFNKQLIQIYENVSRATLEHSNKPQKRQIWKSREIKAVTEEYTGEEEKYVFKRRIDWEAVKKYFGHDRVCNCKCKADKALCRACAASDAVIDELIFEFDNIGQYMKDHCTEIQTFFWMNPGGGQKLRNSVSRIDKSLSDYYKRVKGKCQGRTCKTFSTYIDKRQLLVKTSKETRPDSLTHMNSALAVLADDLNRTVALQACFNERLKEEGDKFINIMNKCIVQKSIEKRSNPPPTAAKKKLIKNVYSLDNINVNIICNPESSSSSESFEHTSSFTPRQDIITSSHLNDPIFDYVFSEPKQKKRKGFKKLFPRKSKKKLFTYYTSDYTKRPRLHFKRQVNYGMMTPLISDSGGAFWYDYIKPSTNEIRVARELKQDKPFQITVVQRQAKRVPKIKKIMKKSVQHPTSSTMFMTVKTTPKRKLRDTETTIDYLTHNINQLLQLFGSLQDIEAMNKNSNRSTMFLNHTAKLKNDQTSKIQAEPDKATVEKKSTKCVKKVKTKMHYKTDEMTEKPTPTTVKAKTTTTQQTTQTTEQTEKQNKETEKELELKEKQMAQTVKEPELNEKQIVQNIKEQEMKEKQIEKEKEFELKEKPSGQNEKQFEQNDKPSEPNDKQSDQIDKPSEITEKPSEQTEKPSELNDKPIEQIEKPSELKEKLFEQSEKQSDQIDKLTELRDEQSDQNDKQFEQSDKPSELKGKQFEQTDKPSEKINKQFDLHDRSDGVTTTLETTFEALDKLESMENVTPNCTNCSTCSECNNCSKVTEAAPEPKKPECKQKQTCPIPLNANDTIIIRDTTSVIGVKANKHKTTKDGSIFTTERRPTKTSTLKTTKKDEFTGLKSPLFDEGETTTQLTTTTSSSFLGKLKTATLKFFDSVTCRPKHPQKTVKSTTDITSTDTTISTRAIDKISTTETDPMYFDDTQVTTTRISPTIVIINEYDNQINNEILNDPNKDVNGYRNLLLSIIQYETNKLNDEWHRIAYGDTEVKRSVSQINKLSTITTTTAKPKKTNENVINAADEEYDVIEGMKNLEIPEPTTKTRKPEGLLNKLVNRMGIKVVTPEKKQAVKKHTPRETGRTQHKKLTRKRRLKLNSWKMESSTMPAIEKACDPRRTPKTSQICDIQATIDHISLLQKKVPTEAFEILVKNISCHKYRNVEHEFFIQYQKTGKRWDWIRNKRCLRLQVAKLIDDETEFDDEFDIVRFDDDSNEDFEKYVKGDDGIYKIITRRKRGASLKALDVGLRNIPPLKPAENEIYIMAGDSITLDCVPYVPIASPNKFHWHTERKRMLTHDNVKVEGIKVTILNAEPKNMGSYTCSMDQAVQRQVQLIVMTIPEYDVVFMPVYKTEESCSYDDLKAIQDLGPLMSKESRCGKACSIRIDEPVCQRDRGTNSSLLRSTAVISMTPQHRVNCSLQCRRDIASSLVMLSAINTPYLTDIAVVLSKDGVNETLRPWRHLVRPVITHSLRKKDTNGHREYHKLVSTLSPGKVDVVVNCPAGYYLIPESKVCSSCPPNTSSKRGDNTCRGCPRGTRAEPGASECHAVNTPPRRYDWWWYPPCGYLVACCSVGFGCSVCILLSVIVHIVSRDIDPVEVAFSEEGRARTPKTGTTVMAAYAHTHTRPLSPSRVILPRFFRPSLTSSRATDSQETKFELWKERNIPPPLPPIDFDI